MNYFIFSNYEIYIYLACKQNAGAGINALMSIFDGLAPSIFRRKMKTMGSMREEMVGKVVYFTPELAFPL